jgi:hypothetical protein
MLIIAVIVLLIAVVALAIAISAVSAVALMAQTSALVSQCMLALIVMAAGAVVIAAAALRNPIVKSAVAYRLLGDKADRVLMTSVPHALPQSARVMLPAGQINHDLTPARLPVAMPAGWGWDEED